MLKPLIATRYVTPLREGGSVPAIVECDDDGLYVAKWRGAAQGRKALVAEVIAAEIARGLGFKVPAIGLISVDASLGRAERDTEIRELLAASVGLNFGIDYLPGSVTFDPIAWATPDEVLASRIVWLDAFLTNIDRTARNPNLLIWHRELWLIDHGASLYFQHDWRDHFEKARSAFAPIRQHVLLRWATRLDEAHDLCSKQLTPELFKEIMRLVPDDWLQTEPHRSPEQLRQAWVEYLTARIENAPIFLAEAHRARSQFV